MFQVSCLRNLIAGLGVSIFRAVSSRGYNQANVHVQETVHIYRKFASSLPREPHFEAVTDIGRGDRHDKAGYAHPAATECSQPALPRASLLCMWSQLAPHRFARLSLR